MRHTITISVPKEFKEELDEITSKEGISRSDIIRESLRDYLFEHRFLNLRKRMMERAAKQGIFTDEDVFKRVS